MAVLSKIEKENEMSKNKTLSAAKSAKNDEFYTQYADIQSGPGSDPNGGVGVVEVRQAKLGMDY